MGFPARTKHVCLFAVFKPALGPIQPRIQHVTDASSPRGGGSGQDLNLTIYLYPVSRLRVGGARIPLPTLHGARFNYGQGQMYLLVTFFWSIRLQI